MFSHKISGLIDQATNIAVIQAENPDGDSLGSALALEEIIGDMGKQVSLYCPVEIPKYLRYFSGWDRITSHLNTKSDLFIIVDTASSTLLSKTLQNKEYEKTLEDNPVIVIDHHVDSTPDINFSHELILNEASSTGEIIYSLASFFEYKINTQAANHILAAILSDTLGLTTQNVSATTFFTAGELTKLGASSAAIEDERRKFMKKSPQILDYKGDLIKRIEYHLDGKLSTIHIPWEEIEKYSDQYNPSVLVLDEMRLVEGVEIGVAIKTYPDGKLTGKIRTNIPVAAEIAGFFGGGGHEYAAGFRVYEQYDQIMPELITAADKILNTLN